MSIFIVSVDFFPNIACYDVYYQLRAVQRRQSGKDILQEDDVK